MADVTAADPARARPPFPAGYRPPATVYDELYERDGSVRAHWAGVLGGFAALGAAEFAERWREARRLLRENGVTYNVYDDAQSAERLWALDPVPVLLTNNEWRAIEHGLVQRAELLEAILADLYGPHTLVRRGLIPPDMIYAHPGFARPCVGVAPPRGRNLPLYAADLARRPNGEFCVLGDRTQAPSGAGYALENRVVLSRTLPSIVRDAHVHRLPHFFRRLRAALGALSTRHDDTPHIVMFTPGPGNETYFEHAFLAGYLGGTLAQGDDLTVRNQRVWLRTLDGPRPVDVIIRRVDGAFCDPLELRGDSLLGVPGLLQAARQRHVAIVNPLGSSVVQNRALLALLPRLARELLGEDLRLPSVPTWWCGDAQGRAHVLAHLERLVIKPIFPDRMRPTVFGGALDAGGRERLTQAILAAPHAFVGQERVSLSTAPTLVDGRLEPRPMVLRAFLAADADGYAAMPGGLARVAPTHDSSVVSNQSGGIGKDVWVLAPEAERDTGLLIPAGRPLPLARSGDEVPGRVADNLFWVGRYAERAEAGARLIREVLRRTLDDAAAYDPQLPLLLRAVTTLTATFPGFVGAGADERLAAPTAELRAVLFDLRRAGSLRFNVAALLRAGRAVRDRFSSDTWRVISDLEREFAEPHSLDGALDLLDRVLLLLAAFGGLSADSMSRGQRWRFLEIGRRLERALSGVALLRVFCPPGADARAVPWETLLGIADASITYRRRYRATADPGAVLDLLIDDETNPRSVLYQLLQIALLLEGLTGSGAAAEPPNEATLVREALAAVRDSAAPDAPQARRIDSLLDTMLASVQERLGALSNHLARDYFSRGAQAQQLVRIV
jgi:uncharacterized circularly permuted ATP-grasp superfamily protein/uncharacterized alpha-E superfamily protein